MSTERFSRSGAAFRTRRVVLQVMATAGGSLLVAIAARLGRTIKWDPKAEKIVGDEQAAGFFARKQRDGFEIHRVS